MLQSLMPLIVVLSWLALPVALVCMFDDWFLRPRRTLAAVPASPALGEAAGQRAGSVSAVAPPAAGDGPVMTLLYTVLPVLIIAAVFRLLLAERLDFSAVLLAITVITGIVWGADAWWLRPRREAAARAIGRDPALVPEPGTVDYARSFFPVALVVLVLRSFIFEPFRIPSDSMMPTLLDGDFIIVNKYAYGLRLPVLNRKVVQIGEPQRGDVVVFRWPRDPSTNFIKRLVGLPGDHVEVRDNRIYINGQPVPYQLDKHSYNDGCYENFTLSHERLGTHEHLAMFCPVAIDRGVPLPSCRRHSPGVHTFVCGDEDAAGGGRVPPYDGVVPPGTYLMMGDNRDNSDDGREWGFVPEENLVGRATRIWFNWDLGRSGGPIWSRIGSAIP
ncbi:MAG TPA: signal peptidase I [Steroidobacteraceae bacterium]|jgi:signal peptidase I|nr:signal peptidase I [Steroidobacteraceae bacterium]